MREGDDAAGGLRAVLEAGAFAGVTTALCLAALAGLAWVTQQTPAGPSGAATAVPAGLIEVLCAAPAMLPLVVPAPAPGMASPGAEAEWPAGLHDLDATWERDWPATIGRLERFLDRWPGYPAAEDKLSAALVADDQVHVQAGQVDDGVAELERAARTYRLADSLVELRRIQLNAEGLNTGHELAQRIAQVPGMLLGVPGAHGKQLPAGAVPAAQIALATWQPGDGRNDVLVEDDEFLIWHGSSATGWDWPPATVRHD